MAVQADLSPISQRSSPTRRRAASCAAARTWRARTSAVAPTPAATGSRKATSTRSALELVRLVERRYIRAILLPTHLLSTLNAPAERHHPGVSRALHVDDPYHLGLLSAAPAT